MTNNNNKKFSSPKIFTKKYSNLPSSSSKNDTNNQSNLKNNSSNITLPNIEKEKIINQYPIPNNKSNISNNVPLPNLSSQTSKYSQIYVPPIPNRLEVKTGIFDSIKAGFFMSMGSRLFDGIFGNREVKVIENKEDNKCLELKEMFEKCMKENNESCKDFFF
jgi:hypothetical protein